MNMPMQQRPQMPPQQAAAGAPAAPQAPMDGMQDEFEEGMGGPEINGEELQMLLFSRVQELSQPEMMILDQMITPQTVPVLFKLFPELGILFEQGTQLQGMSPQGQANVQQMPAGSAYESENPLVNDGNLSQGLMG